MQKKNNKLKSFRSLKIVSVIKRKLSSLILGMDDKRVGIITINDINLSKDFRYGADIRIFFK